LLLGTIVNSFCSSIIRNEGSTSDSDKTSALGSIMEDTALGSIRYPLVVKKVLGLPPSKAKRLLPKSERPESAPVSKRRGNADRNFLVVTKLSKFSQAAVNQEIKNLQSFKPTRPSTTNNRRTCKSSLLDDTILRMEDSDMVNREAMTLGEISQIRPYMSAMATAVIRAEAYDRRQIRRQKLKLRRNQRDQTAKLPCLQRLSGPKDAKKRVLSPTKIRRAKAKERGSFTTEAVVKFKSTNLLQSKDVDCTGRDMGPFAFRQLNCTPVNSSLVM